MPRAIRRRVRRRFLLDWEGHGYHLLRILWPTGVLQDEINLPQGPTIAMKEVDRRGSSCPVLFTWNGHNYSS